MIRIKKKYAKTEWPAMYENGVDQEQNHGRGAVMSADVVGYTRPQAQHFNDF